MVATSAKAAKPSTAPKRIPPAASAAPIAAKLSKDELRAQVEKLESANAALRTKSREANKAAQTAAARISELEQQVAQLEKAALAAMPVKSSVKPAKPVGAKRRSGGAGTGNTVPPEATAQKPESLADEPGTALEGSGDE